MQKGLRRTATALVLLSMAFFLLCACEKPKEYKLSGATMGTVYNVRFTLPKGLTTGEVAAAIERELAMVDGCMSVFNPHSEISRFNAFSVNAPFSATPQFYHIMQFAQNLHRAAYGAWDGTVMPLVNLWGFGPQGRRTAPPAHAEIYALLHTTGFDKIELGPGQTIIKRAGVTVDLSAIAKGYGVDCIAAALSDMGLPSFLVEIGGELYAKGLKPDKSKWRVGINRPDPNAMQEEIYAVAELSGMAMATSGNYRNFFVSEGKAFAHIIDPRTGYPVDNGIVSVTVIAPACLKADGLATAMTVLGIDQSLELAASDPEIAVFIIEQDGAGGLVNHVSDSMRLYLAPQ